MKQIGIVEELLKKTVFDSTDRPPLLPRRSTRPSRKPKYFDDFVCKMTNIENRQLDVKLDALSKFMESGLLNLVTSEVAHRIVEAIMK